MVVTGPAWLRTGLARRQLPFVVFRNGIRGIGPSLSCCTLPLKRKLDQQHNLPASIRASNPVFLFS